jgi:hypothetical protein
VIRAAGDLKPHVRALNQLLYQPTPPKCLSAQVSQSWPSIDLGMPPAKDLAVQQITLKPALSLIMVVGIVINLTV